MKDDFRLTGTRFPRHRFVALEGQGFVEPDKLTAVLAGLQPAYIIRDFIAKEACGALRMVCKTLSRARLHRRDLAANM